MNSEHLEKLKPMEYADIEGQQLKRLRDLETEFNEEFGTEFYFMVMKKGNK